MCKILNNRIIALLLCCVALVHCSTKDKEVAENPLPKVTLGVMSCEATSVTLKVARENAAYVNLLCVTTEDASSQTVESVVTDGKRYTSDEVVIDQLTGHTAYTVFAVACNDKGQSGELQSVPFTTGIPVPEVSLSVGELGATSATLHVELENAAYIYWLCVATDDVDSQSVENVVRMGVKCTESKIIFEYLSGNTTYTIFAVACNDAGTTGPLRYTQLTTLKSEPKVRLSFLDADANSAMLGLRSEDADCVYVLCVAADDVSTPTVESVVARGVRYTDPRIVVEGLSRQTDYMAFAVACAEERRGALESVRFTTRASDPQMYAWEQSREKLLSFSDMVLCYGGSYHRNPGLWSQSRFEPFVTYTDKQGTDHWLFDSFLCLEFQYGSYTFERGRPQFMAAPKQVWQYLIDYWFASDNGMSALEGAVKEAAQRMGPPPTKRKVVVGMPEPVIYQYYNQMTASTTYWGELNGRVLNFAIPKDRVDACRWYIDLVRQKFDEANYQYIELAGFYIVSEDLYMPDTSWNYEFAKSDELIVPISRYLHSINQSLSWIPYATAVGHDKWWEFGVDHAYLQPTYFWGEKDPETFAAFFPDIKRKNMGMELEFDDALLAGRPNYATYKARFREYMSKAKSEGVYGTKPLSYYQGDNTVYNLWNSKSPEDQELYHEFCQFVIGNPLRK